jgi:predicted MFS family arabinose efflux permease
VRRITALGGEKPVKKSPFPWVPPTLGGVNKLCIFVGVNVGGYLGWVALEKLGMMASFIGSGIGSVAGVYFGWKLAKKIEE